MRFRLCDAFASFVVPADEGRIEWSEKDLVEVRAFCRFSRKLMSVVTRLNVISDVGNRASRDVSVRISFLVTDGLTTVHGIFFSF